MTRCAFISAQRAGETGLMESALAGKDAARENANAKQNARDRTSRRGISVCRRLPAIAPGPARMQRKRRERRVGRLKLIAFSSPVLDEAGRKMCAYALSSGLIGNRNRRREQVPGDDAYIACCDYLLRLP